MKTRAALWSLVGPSAFLMISTVVSSALAIPGDRICDKDVQRLCPNVPRGEGQIGRCLSKQNLTISLECRAFWEQFRSQQIQTKNHCYGFVRQFCLSVPPGNGRVVACLRKNLNGISNDCTKDLERIPSFGFKN